LAKRKPIRKKVESPFSKNLQAMLSERAISQSAAAKLAQIPAATLHDWIYGSNIVPQDIRAVQRLCRALGCSFEWVMTGEISPVDFKNISLTELFQSEPDPTFSGIFEITARRLTRIKKD